MSDLAEGEDRCWKTMDCPEYVHTKCPAYLHPQRPCWEVSYTRSEALTSLGKDCDYCKVYRLCHGFADPSKPEA